MKLLVAACLAVALTACASSPTVSTDHAPGTDFSKFRTYTWIAEPDGAPPLVAQRIIAGINAELQAKGMTEVPSGGDASIAAHVARTQKQSIDTFYSAPMYSGWGWRGGGMYGGMGMSNSTVRTYDVGTLVVDLFDTATKQAVWRGAASATVPSSQEKVDATVRAGIAKMFLDFPPGSAPAK